ncbi:MAG: integrase, partial [Desulfobacteraceae bacterium]|nr:integrase [Desulfobacteraceae bacterium]
MIKGSCDPGDQRFIFITQKARTINNYQGWLEKEFNREISLPALRRCVKEENLKKYLEKPDFEESENPEPYFETEPVFDLIQMDGSILKYLKIKNEAGKWQAPRVIEFYDTGSRYMFVLDFFFSESSANSVELFLRFLLDRPFPTKTIRLRPDRAGGFLNLKRPIMDLNLRFSMPGGFYLKPDFARAGEAKDKAHLESSHRGLHNFEIKIIKEFEDRIVDLKPGYTYKNRRKEQITVTYLDIDIEQLRESNILEEYRKQRNNRKHCFAQEGKTIAWTPAKKLETFLEGHPTIEFTPEDVQHLIRYGFEKKRATVTKKKFITYGNQRYYVAVGAEKFSKLRSTKVKISAVNDKLLIFDDKDDGVLLGEALCQKAPDKQKNKPEPKLPANEVEQITEFLKKKGMIVDRFALIERCRKGLTLGITRNIYADNKPRYDNLTLKLNQSKR